MKYEEAAEDFKKASDELRKAVTLQEIAAECGVSVESLQRSMLSEDSKAYVPPPRFWKGDLALLARGRAKELTELADELEASAWAPATEEELEEIGSMILDRFDKVLQPETGLAVFEGWPADFEARRAEIEKRQAEFQERREDVEKRRAERKKRREERLEQLNRMFLGGILKGP